jgi:hypothetical protein
MTGYDFTRFAFQRCFGIHVFKCFQFWLWDRAKKIHRLSYRESTVNKVSALFFFTFVDSRQQRILYFSGSMHACRNIHETWRVGLYIKRVLVGTSDVFIKNVALFLHY